MLRAARIAVLLFLGGIEVRSLELTRGPYLQSGSPHSVVVRWRTDINTDSMVRFGTNVADLGSHVFDPVNKTEHEIRLSGLAPDRKYYYSVGDENESFASGPDCFFVTAPLAAKPTRIWVLGDSGTANFDALAVRDAYQALAGTRHTDLWLMLGDNAYESGFDHEYQEAVFEMYPEMLRKSVLWPTIGNHDAPYPPFTHFPYLDIFTLPTQGEAGGLGSGTERYYSFDYGNIHFVCLDSMTVSRGSNAPMCNWLREDLAANDKDWLIAFWHHPPYSRGSHNSDYELELTEMRQNVVPILEEYGVDLVLSGHSHSYERSYLLDGHYGTSDTLQPHMIKDSSGGRACETGGYFKQPGTSRAGAVYTVAGSSGQVGPSAKHPAMFMHLSILGSLVLDVDGDLMVARFLDATGRIADEFSIRKGTRQPDCTEPDGGSIPNIVWKTNAHTAPVRRVAFAPGGATLASCGEDGMIRLWAVTNGAHMNEWRADNGITDNILFLPDATYLISSGSDGLVKFWQNFEPTLNRALEANFLFQAQHPIAYTPPGLLASSATTWNPFGYWMAGWINLWRVTDGALLRTIAAEHAGGLDFSPDGTHLISADRFGIVRRWRVSDGAYMGSIPTLGANIVKYAPPGVNLIATAGSDRTVRLWRATDGSLVRTLIGHNDAISALGFSPDGTMLVTAGQFDSTLRFWRLNDGELLQTFFRECYAVKSIAFSSDGYFFAYGRSDNVVVLAHNPFPPMLAKISGGAAVEGGSAGFTVRVRPGITESVSINFITTEGSARAGTDFVHTNGTITFAPGETNKTIQIATINDALRETNEVFGVVLTNPIDGAMIVATGTGLIVDDDPLPVVAVTGATIEEADAALTFAVSLSTPTHQTVTMDYFADNETAYAPEDYQAAGGSLTFAPGETQKTVAISVREDSASEQAEAFELRLFNVKNASLSEPEPSAPGWIIDDDSVPGQLASFEWGSIDGAQVVNEPFPVSIRALDAAGETVASFSGVANLTGLQAPAVLFRDDFEDGDISDWVKRAAAYVREVTNDTAAAGARSLTLIGGGRYRMDGVAYRFNGIQPGRINFHVRSASTTKSGAYLVAATNDTLQGSAICFRMDGTNGMGLEEGGRFHGIPYVPFRWYKVSLVLDWTAQRVSYYVDGQLVAQNIPFCTPNVRPLRVVHLYNFDHMQSWWDDVEFLQETETTPVAIAPSTSGNFVNGVWSGEITVMQPATHMHLVAEANGRTGVGNTFSAVAFKPVVVQPPLSQSIVVGGNVTFSALMSGTLPMQYEWRKLQPPLFTNQLTLNDHLSFFAISNVQPDRAGSYSLVVRNVAGIAAAPFTLNVLADTDLDGLPDAWETAFTTGDPTGDADGDAMSNLAEYQAGTVPTNALSLLRLDAILSGNELHLSFQAISNKTYTLEHTPALSAPGWLKLADIPARGTNYTYFRIVAIGPQSFYRLVTPAHEIGP